VYSEELFISTEVLPVVLLTGDSSAVHKSKLLLQI